MVKLQWLSNLRFGGTGTLQKRLPLVLLTCAVAGCQAMPLALPARLTDQRYLPLVEVTEVEPAAELGSYTVRGQADLPDGTRVALTAVRHFQGKTDANEAAAPYAILDRQDAVVTDGQWSGLLRLLQTDPKGGESWQVRSGWAADLDWTPLPEVEFTVSLDPSQQTAALRRRLEQDANGFESGQVRISQSGELYAIAAKPVAVPPPSWVSPPQPPPAPSEVRQAEPLEAARAAPTSDKAPPPVAEAYLQQR